MKGHQSFWKAKKNQYRVALRGSVGGESREGPSMGGNIKRGPLVNLRARGNVSPSGASIRGDAVVSLLIKTKAVLTSEGNIDRDWSCKHGQSGSRKKERVEFGVENMLRWWTLKGTKKSGAIGEPLWRTTRAP